MPHDGYLLNTGLHVFGDLDDSRQLRIASHNAAEKIVENAFDLAIDQVVDLKLIQSARLLQLPGSWAADNNLRLIFLDNRMGNYLEKLSGVKGHQVFAKEFGVDFRRVRNPQRVMRVDCQYLCLRANKLFQVIAVASNDVCFSIFSEQQRLDHAQTVRDKLRAAVRPRLVSKRDLIENRVA